MSSSSILPLPFAEIVNSTSEDDFVPLVFVDDHEEFPPLLSGLASGGGCDWEFVEDNDFGDDATVVFHNNNDDGWAHIDRLYRTFAEAAAARTVGAGPDQKAVSAIRFRHGLESQKFHPCSVSRSGSAARRWSGKQRHSRTIDEQDMENEMAFHGPQRRNRKRKLNPLRQPFTEKAAQATCH